MTAAMPPAARAFCTRFDVGVLVAQGYEAGGHGRDHQPVAMLVPAVVAAVAPVPVLAAGGVTTGRDLAALRNATTEEWHGRLADLRAAADRQRARYAPGATDWPAWHATSVSTSAPDADAYPRRPWLSRVDRVQLDMLNP